MSTWSRRRVLAAGATLVALAGCVESGDDGAGDDGSGTDDTAGAAGEDGTESDEQDDSDTEDGQKKADDDDQKEAGSEEDDEPEIQSSEIETTDVGGRSGDPEEPTYDIDGETVTIEGAIPTRNICQDRTATLETVDIEDGVLGVSLGFDRDSPESPCLNALGQVEYLITVTVTNAKKLQNVRVTYPEEADQQPQSGDDGQLQPVDDDNDDSRDDSY